MTPELRRFLGSFLTRFIPATVLIVHALAFGTWVMDDAGISFAYAKNLAAGNGLVHQLGAEPVEGYSNPAWVFLLSAAFVLKVFHPVWLPKVLSVFLVILAFELQYRSLRRWRNSLEYAAVLAAVLVSLQTGFVAWCVSGLENSLYVLALSLLSYQCVSYLLDDRPAATGAVAGMAAFLVAWTRPEGIVYAIVFPVTVLVRALQSNVRHREVRALAVYLATLGLPIIAYMSFRLLYFGDWLPNTYYAKGGPQLVWLIDFLLLRPWSMGKIAGVVETITGSRLLMWLPLALVITAIFCLWNRRPAVLLPAIFTAVSAGAYVLLPGDWMPGFRFATPFYFFSYFLFAITIFTVIGANRSPRRQFLFLIAAVASVVGTGYLAVERTTQFAAAPPISLREVRESAARFEEFSSLLGVSHPTLLHADIGAFVFDSSIRIYDLGMLCDRTIAKALGEGVEKHDQQAFYDYVFEDTKPTFIATRAYHSWIARLHDDPRFERDYVEIKEFPDRWIFERYGEDRSSGDYVRRENVTPDLLALMRLRVEGLPYAGCDSCSATP